MTFTATISTLCTSLLLLAGCASKTAHSPDETPKQVAPSATSQSQQVLLDISAAYPAMSATVISQDRVVWSFTHGSEGVGPTRSTSDSTRFNTYSVAKAVTGLAFARLIERDAVRLDTKVSEIAPDLSETFHDIRVQDILSYTSGIRHYVSPEDWISFAARTCVSPMEGLAYFEADALIHQPGDAETYSTFAFVLASELLIRPTDAPSFIDALNETLGPWSGMTLDHAGAEKA
jgi:CubicO group peptidase (beta-lactamase class C family)